MRSVRSTWVAVAVAFTVCTVSADYTEVVSTRSVYRGTTSPIPPGWAVLPTSSVQQLVEVHKAGMVVAVGSSQSSSASQSASSSASSSALFRALTSATELEFVEIALSMPIKADPSLVRVVVDASGELVALVTPSCVYSLTCTTDLSSCTVGSGQPRDACGNTTSKTMTTTFGPVSDTVVVGSTVWVACEAGLYTVALDAGSVPPTRIGAVGANVTAVVARGTTVIVGSSAKIWFVDSATTKVDRWEWVTDVGQEWGGVIDGAITSMAVGPKMVNQEGLPSGVDLYVGNPVCLNVQDGVTREFRRVGADEGLPYGNITAVVPVTHNSKTQLWLGTTMGVAMWQPGGDPSWRYFFGPRWLSGSKVVTMCAAGNAVFVATDAGVTRLSLETWTLARKAAAFEAVLLARHDRHGLTSECSMLGYGDVKGCIQHDNDNNGLWTSLVVAAMYMAHSVTGDPQTLATASKYFNGLVLLNRITNIPGLMARSACAPDEIAAGTCAGNGTWIHDKTTWVNSTAVGYEGWLWKTDTSSDESTGHVFAFPIVASLSPIAAERETARQLVNDIVGGIVKHRYLLIDHTGLPTTWGRWAPSVINFDRAWSDERGLQSLQMLAYISAGMNATDPDNALWTDAVAELTNSSNQYYQNMLNLKITTPIDDNFSDDELTFLPFFTYLSACPAKSRCATTLDRGPALAALNRTWRIVRKERSALWTAMAISVGSNDVVAPSEQASSVKDVLWNLRTWPLDMIQWPVQNSHRLDIIYDRSINRFGSAGTDSWHSQSPLPANERAQGRWNGDPWDVSDGGNGMTEMDPGAWLLPYWLGRFSGIVSATD